MDKRTPPVPLLLLETPQTQSSHSCTKLSLSWYQDHCDKWLTLDPQSSQHSSQVNCELTLENLIHMDKLYFHMIVAPILNVIVVPNQYDFPPLAVTVKIHPIWSHSLLLITIMITPSAPLCPRKEPYWASVFLERMTHSL